VARLWCLGVGASATHNIIPSHATPDLPPALPPALPTAHATPRPSPHDAKTMTINPNTPLPRDFLLTPRPHNVIPRLCLPPLLPPYRPVLIALPTRTRPMGLVPRAYDHEWKLFTSSESSRSWPCGTFTEEHAMGHGQVRGNEVPSHTSRAGIYKGRPSWSSPSGSSSWALFPTRLFSTRLDTRAEIIYPPLIDTPFPLPLRSI
jgi:hypothetical protein